jgi:hypothetical protein
MSLATMNSALGLLAQKDQEREQELARKASSKATREAAKINKLALQAVAAEKRGVEKERRKRVPKFRRMRDCSLNTQQHRRYVGTNLRHPLRSDIAKCHGSGVSFLCTTYHSFMSPLLYHKVHLTPVVYTTLPFPYIYYP